MSTDSATDLSVRSESLQRLYDLYVNDRFRVNRRYQRKLVWSVEEKQRLIDSIAKDLPIPLFLVAEIGGSDVSYELIDGMQRLNAIFAFLENEFALGEEYFDLNALADTKLRLDRGELSQKTPVMSREQSVALANYSVALSIFRAGSSASVDEVFRRINSGGRRLSRQELRQAGTTSLLATQVRVIASLIRGDTSPRDVVPLRSMARLSISNRELDYGVQVDDIFWVKEGVLRREDVRESYDEQVILDLIADMVIDPLPSSGSRLRDEYYSYTPLGEEDEPTSAARAITHAIQAYGEERLSQDFIRIYDEIRSAVVSAGPRFASHIGIRGGARSPRYYHVIFIAIYELVCREGMRVKDYARLADRMKGITSSALAVPGGGGDWQKEAKRVSVDAVKGVLRDAFEPAPQGEDLGRFGRATELETLLGNALVEQQTFDCKQGFLSLGATRDFDEDSFEKICATLTAMANVGPDAVGYVAIGIADSQADAARASSLDGIAAVVYRGFHVVGIEREATVRAQTINDYWSWLIQRLRVALPSPLGSIVASSSRLVSYNERAVALLKVSSVGKPVFFNGNLFERSGSDTLRLDQEDFFRIASRFMVPGS
jgi:hypothetical protein